MKEKENDMNFECLSPKEIRDRYNWAEDKRHILDVLGDLTCSSAEAIAAMLGVECPERYPAYHYIPVTSRKESCHIQPTLMRPLYDEGLSDREIAEKLGYSRTSVGKWRRKEGLALNAKPVNTIDKEEARRLYRKGYTDRQIAEALGTTKATISSWRYRKGLPVNRGTETEVCKA